LKLGIASSSSPGRREFLLGDDEDDDTENSGYSVSSLDEDLSYLAPSTKILRFPFKKDTTIVEIRY
jgi:hypothetical protein